LNQRAEVDSEKRNIAYSTKGQALLSGNVYCAHCGGKMTTIRYRDKRIRKDGSVYEIDQIKYCCYHKTRKLCKCDGQTTYVAERIDAAISEIMRRLFRSIAGTPHEDKLNMLIRKHVTVNRAMQSKNRKELEKEKKQLEVLQLEIGKALTGESLYTANDLNQAIIRIKGQINRLEAEQLGTKSDELRYEDALKTVSATYSRLKSWAEEFDSATLEQRKMIACQLFRRIELGRDYTIKAELNMTYEQFCKEWNQISADEQKAV
jgi:site-specific DNA recombinase